MALVPLKIPPGVYRNGTEYQAAGRYYDANLVRWHEGQMRPIGGWDSFSANLVTGRARGIKAWTDDNSTAWIAIGTHTNLYAMNRIGGLFDITPADYVAGLPDAMTGGGYGTGFYGEGTYGTLRTSDTSVQAATVWSLDTFGQYLVACADTQQEIYQWTLDTGVLAQPLANAPSATAIVVTKEFFLFALAAKGNPRLVAWCDQQDDTVWAAGPLNQAGELELQTAGKIMCGAPITSGTLIWTDIDVFLATYLANVDVYGFQLAGAECGIVSRKAFVTLTNKAFWMGAKSFYQYDGFVSEVPCEVSDYVFGDLNQLQSSKIHAIQNAAFGEITWYYPSAASIEIDRYVTYSYVEKHWEIGKLQRLCAADRGVFPFPLKVDLAGELWSHETGLTYGGDFPYARHGPLELDDGARVVLVTGLLPDVSPLGAVTVTAYTRFYPEDTETAYGPYALTPTTDMLFECRQLELLYTGTPGLDWRIGNGRLDVTPGGPR